jgi:hypothetical protein
MDLLHVIHLHTLNLLQIPFCIDNFVSGILVCSSLKLAFLVNLRYRITYVPSYL